jgi:hypothetical protein
MSWCGVEIVNAGAGAQSAHSGLSVHDSGGARWSARGLRTSSKDSSSSSGRSVPIDHTTDIPEELFNDLMLAGQEARLRGQHELVEERRARRQRLVMAGAHLLTAPVVD